MNDPAVREALDRLVVELRTNHSTVYEMLNRMDRNKDGILSRDEIRRGLAEMGVQLTATELDSVMRAFDKDHNGKIDWFEFYTVLTQHAAPCRAVGFPSSATTGCRSR
jgi:Ca2+-binding EF-hand superfamily protein